MEVSPWSWSTSVLHWNSTVMNGLDWCRGISLLNNGMLIQLYRFEKIIQFSFFFFFIAEKVNKAQQQYSGCQRHNFPVCNLGRFLNCIIPWSGVKVMVLWVMKLKVGHFPHSSLTLHTYFVCLLFDSINYFKYLKLNCIIFFWHNHNSYLNQKKKMCFSNCRKKKL